MGNNFSQKWSCKDMQDQCQEIPQSQYRNLANEIVTNSNTNEEYNSQQFNFQQQQSYQLQQQYVITTTIENYQIFDSQRFNREAIINGWQQNEKINNLEIYMYPQLNLNQSQKNNSKNILLVGQSGSGKTTLLNGFSNYLAGIDFQDDFRFKLIDERNIINQNGGEHESVTQNVNQYFVKNVRNSQVYRIIDTPGFLDSKGISRDMAIIKQIYQYLKTSINKIDIVCFVVISSLPRLNCAQKWIFNTVLELFGLDIKHNICIMATFADEPIPKVLASLKQDGVPYQDYFTFNNSVLYQPVKSSTDQKNNDQFRELFWKMWYQSMDKFFCKTFSFKTKSLQQTYEVIEKRTALSSIIDDINPMVVRGLQNLENARQQINHVQVHEDQINQSKDFTYKFKEEKFKQIDLPVGQHTTTCKNCNRTCHTNCIYSSNDDKMKCIAMDKQTGYCKVCPGKCYWDMHSNLPYLIEFYTVQSEKHSSELYQKYVIAKSKKTKCEQVISGLKKELKDIYIKLINLLANLRNCLQELQKIALRPNPKNTKQILQDMRMSQMNDRKPGYQDKLKVLDEFISKCDILEKAANNNEEVFKEWTKDYESVVNQLSKIDSANSNQDDDLCIIQ